MNDNTTRTIETASPEETAELGRALGTLLGPGHVLALIGPLGAGKTQLTQGLALGLGAPERVTSPTFKLVNEYHGRIVLYHLDAYRLHGADDMIALGCDEFFDGAGAAVVEWADLVAPALPDDRLEIRIELTGETSRTLTFTPAGPNAAALLAALD
jgi:tRNA threonylcarbamoyladenosine biosynthesis protein TsaE